MYVVQFKYCVQILINRYIIYRSGFPGKKKRGAKTGTNEKDELIRWIEEAPLMKITAKGTET